MKMERAEQRAMTVKLLRASDPDAQFDPPVPGTMAERLGMGRELTLMGVSLGGGDDQQRLQRHVTRLTGGGR
jgi:hypothetical protein